MARPLSLTFTVQDGTIHGVLFQESSAVIPPKLWVTVKLDLNRRDANREREPFTGWEEWFIEEHREDRQTSHVFPREELERRLQKAVEPLTAVVLASEIEAQFALVDGAVEELGHSLEALIREPVQSQVDTFCKTWNRSFSWL